MSNVILPTDDSPTLDDRKSTISASSSDGSSSSVTSSDGAAGDTTTSPDWSEGGSSSTTPPPSFSPTTTTTSTSTRSTSRITTSSSSRSSSSASSTRVNDVWVTSTRPSTQTSSPQATLDATQPSGDSSSQPKQDAVAPSASSVNSGPLPTDVDEPDTSPARASDVASTTDSTISSDSDAILPPATRKARLSPTDMSPVASDPVTLDNTASSLDEGASDSGLDGSAKAGVVVGVLTAVCAILLAIHLFRKRVIAKRRKKYLKHHSNMFQHQRTQSDFSWLGKAQTWDEKSDGHGDNDGRPDHQQELPNSGFPPQVDLIGPVSTPSEGAEKTWSSWMGRFAPARPPSSTSSAASAAYLADRDLRISVVAPSPVSSRTAAFQQPGTHSRASSTLSGNHLHPIHARLNLNQRPFSVRSRESLATVNESSGEPSPVLANITDKFPIPASSRSTLHESQFPILPAIDTTVKPFASNNPFRNSVGQPRSPLHRHSPLSDDGGRNPFELELESGSLEIDFTRVGITPLASGHSTIHPTTPITPKVRRKSTSSLSLYSEDGGHFRNNSNNPFDVGPSPTASAHHSRPVPVRDSVTEALDLAENSKPNTWSVLDSYSAGSSRRPSYTSEKSGPDPSAWADELVDQTSHTLKTFSRILDMYAGRAM